MTDVSVAAARFAKNDLRVGSIISRSGAVLSRHFLIRSHFAPTFDAKNLHPQQLTSFRHAALITP